MWLEIQLACHPVALSVRIHVLGLAIFVAVGGMSPKSAEWGAGAVSSTFGPFEIVPNPVKFFFAEQVLFASIRKTGTEPTRRTRGLPETRTIRYIDYAKRRYSLHFSTSDRRRPI